MATNQPKLPARGETTEERVRHRLREPRLANGLTLRQVATRAHLDVSTLSRLESGKRRLALDHLPSLADALGVSTDERLTPLGPPYPGSRPGRSGATA